MDSRAQEIRELLCEHPLSEILEVCIGGTSKYYDYLLAEDKGLTRTKVTKIRNGGFSEDGTIFEIVVAEHIVSIDYISLELSGQPTDITHFKPTKYDKRTKVLYVLSMSGKMTTTLAATPANKVFVVSDLKFLVSSTLRYFMRQAPSIMQPHIKPSVKPETPTHLNSKQKEALEAIFTHPMSYIWGAPGTGKTKAVMAAAISSYIKSKAHIAIFAPTNNALEQILYGLLPELISAGISTKKILRIGAESEAFRELYPDVCEMQYSLEMDAGKFSTYKRSPAKASVVAATLDTYILREDLHLLQFDHHFLDEAGFANQIKTLAICTNGTPLTLLGDHCQLSPVCEMSKAEQAKSENSDVFVWGMSGIYIGNLLTKTPNEAKQIYFDDGPPSFELLHKVDLLQTHRYGKNLAHILDSMIYKNGLFSSLEDTGVYFVDTGVSAIEGLANEIEAKAVKKLIEKLRTKKTEEIGILTPFNNQVKLLKKLLPIEKDTIMTIHKSQGREFDIVVFSPVSLHYHLTNSDNKQARYAINVALSRVKQTLIIVCDVAMWMKNDRQLITKILQNGIEIKMS